MCTATIYSLNMYRHVWVVVLGDFGRSPRMQYHTLSLSQQGFSVSVIAMPGSQPIQPLRNNPQVSIHHISELPGWAARLPTLVGLLAKALWQLLLLLWLMLVQLPRPQAILMQNPPAIPSMLVCWLAAKRHGAQWIIDWHNFAYTIMQLKYARHAWLINLAKAYEKLLGRQAQAGFCVTSAMQHFLNKEFGVKATVLYDRPPEMFHACSVEETHRLMGRLQQQLTTQGIGQCLQHQLADAAAAHSGQQGTLLTCRPAAGGSNSKQQLQAAMRPGRPALVVSSTSWTPDENFGILLAAAQQYDTTAAGRDASSSSSSSSSSYPDVVFVITGRGPDREAYLAKIRQLKLSKVAFCSLWLEPEDYPLMLGAADLGVCLHTSSSGLDLPMKVVDMFGAGLPVCAVDYQCIGELVADGHTGLLFSSAEQLAQQLLDLLKGFDGATGSGSNGQLTKLRAGVSKEQAGWRWQDNWDKGAAPLFAAAVAAAGGDAGDSNSSGSKAGKLKQKKLA